MTNQGQQQGPRVQACTAGGTDAPGFWPAGWWIVPALLLGLSFWTTVIVALT